MLQISPEVKTDIQNAVNAGKEVTISQTNVQIYDWIGVGYIIKDPITGAGAYMISGGLAGGGSMSKADAAKIAQAFMTPLQWVLEMLNMVMGGTIAYAAEMEVGELIAETAEAQAKARVGYKAAGRCSGLVRVAYKAAGICLDNTEPPTGFSCSNSLMDKYGLSSTFTDSDGGVYRHHALADKLKINKSVRRTNDPWVGDIVFFNDAEGVGYPLDHEGIVISLPNGKGMVRFIHAAFGGVREDKLNLEFPGINDKSEDIANGNSWVGDYCDKVPNENACLADALFAGFGTIRDK